MNIVNSIVNMNEQLFKNFLKEARGGSTRGSRSVFSEFIEELVRDYTLRSVAWRESPTDRVYLNCISFTRTSMLKYLS